MNENNAVAVQEKQGMSLVPTSIKELESYANRISNTTFVPQSYKGKPGDIMVAIQMGMEVGLQPIQALQNIAVINGRPSIWGDALLALVQSHPAYGGIQETFDDATMTATCSVTRKGESPHVITFSRKDAETAGLWGKQGPWKAYPKRMLQQRARGFALRDKFSDALKGMITSEEARDFPPVKDVTPQPAPAPSIEPVEAEPVDAELVDPPAPNPGYSDGGLTQLIEAMQKAPDLPKWWTKNNSAINTTATPEQLAGILAEKDKLKTANTTK